MHSIVMKIFQLMLILSLSARGCASDEGFQLRGSSIDSGDGHADDARILLFLGTAGFKRSNLSPGLGTITFEFEMQCEGPCMLKFYQVSIEYMHVLRVVSLMN